MLKVQVSTAELKGSMYASGNCFKTSHFARRSQRAILNKLRSHQGSLLQVITPTYVQAPLALWVRFVDCHRPLSPSDYGLMALRCPARARGGFLKVIPIGIPTYAGMKTGFHADVSPKNRFSCRRRSECRLKLSLKTRLRPHTMLGGN